MTIKGMTTTANEVSNNIGEFLWIKGQTGFSEGKAVDQRRNLASLIKYYAPKPPYIKVAGVVLKMS